MAKEVLIYSSFEGWTAERFVTQLEEAKGQDLITRVNSPGGDVTAGYSMLVKFSEFEGLKKIKVDGQAASIAAFFLVYAEDVEAADFSTFLIHRAAYPSWIENSDSLFTEAKKKLLAGMNETLRSGFESKIDVPKFEKIAGHTMDEIFSMDGRIDVVLNAKEAKSIGLINTIVKLSPVRKQAMKAHYSEIAASAGNDVMPAFLKEPEAIIESSKQSKNKHMTIEKLKADHPEIYAQVVESARAEELDRVEAIMVYSHLDLDKVKTVIASGKNMSQKDIAELNLKQIDANALALVVAESVPVIPTSTVEGQDSPDSPEMKKFKLDLDKQR